MNNIEMVKKEKEFAWKTSGELYQNKRKLQLQPFQGGWNGSDAMLNFMGENKKSLEKKILLN